MPQLPEQLRPIAAVIAKHHFWMLAAIVPLVLVPLLMQGTGSLDKRISDQRSQIDGKVSALKGVQGIAEHPNEAWAKAVEEQTAKIREETLAEWTTFWEAQQPIRVWPDALGPDFTRAVAALKPGASLARPHLLKYQNTVRDIVRGLPSRMGADDLMLRGATTGAADASPGPRPAPGGFGPRPGGDFGPPRGFVGESGPRPGPETTGSSAVVSWSDADQLRIYKSFTWEKAPSTMQVLLAQEELWVYGLFCDAIKRLNAGASGPFNASISAVLELAVGYPAAEDQPGGEGTGRIIVPEAAAVGGEFGGEGGPPPGPPAGLGMPGDEGGAVGRPFHPRFATGGPGSGRGPTAGGGEGGGDPAAGLGASPDDQLREWIYVDFAGKPLTAAELATVPSAKMVHLVPFTLRVTMDQRRLDALLADLASSVVPIDVRQVRINPSQQQSGPRSGPGRGASRGESGPPTPAADGGAAAGPRPFDVTVELRGTVGVAPPPDVNAIGGGTAAAPGDGA